MNRSEILFPPQHAALREDVHALGSLVGEILREQGGAALLDLLTVVPAPPAGVGTTEWYATFIFATGLGQPVEATAAAALLYHAAWLLIVLVAGAASLAAVGEMLPRRAAGPAS